MDNVEISRLLGKHYSLTFDKFGPTLKGVDWSSSSEKEALRLSRVLKVIRNGSYEIDFSILDVGCGYGAAVPAIRAISKKADYFGIDIVEPMINYATERYPDCNFYIGDFLQLNIETKFDYVICNGILTQKLTIDSQDMTEFSKRIIVKMFELCDIGISFNIMSAYSNFQASNLFYLKPQDLVSWIAENLSTHFVVDNSSSLYEFTTHVYKEGKSK